MKRNAAIVAMLMLLMCSMPAYAAFTVPDSGKVYRIHNVKSEKVIGEDCIARELMSTDAAGSDDLKQLWLLKKSKDGYLVQNAYSGQYIQHNPHGSTVYPTGSQESVMYITSLGGTKYAIGQSSDAYLHLDNSGNIVRWWDEANTGSQWQFEEVSVSSEAIALQQAAFQEFYAEYQAKLELMGHLDEYNTLLPTFFADVACTELLPTYAAMTDDELRTAMAALPASLQEIAVKVKNQSWGHREQEFRIRNYKAYSDPIYWADVLYTKKYSRLNNPTGVYGNAGDVLYIFVDNDIPEGTELKAEVISGTAIEGTATTLTKGLNMVPTVKDCSNLFIRYVGETSMESDVLITDYPELKIHVEQGVVNGFWNIEEHDDADWVDMMTNLATSDVFQVKGERMMFHMSTKYMYQCCPTTITDAIGWWDDMIRWQQDMMGIEDVRLKKFNNLGCAISLTSGYQSATHYRTQYAETYIGNLLPYNVMMSNADNCWGPAHENGHVHQAAITSVGISEVSNNFFSNLTMNKLGKYTSRGMANSRIFEDYANHTPYILRDGAITLRSFWQLYLYFHEAKVDTTFYPRVFQAMRATPMKARDPQYYALSVYGNEDLLLFAKACCDVAQLDLSEFFRFWGYLELTDKQHIGDYADYYLTNRQSDVDEFLAHAAQYPKAPSIIFIEDRVKPVSRTDGGEGYKQRHANSISASEAGDVGHYTDFMDTSVKAEGYIYKKTNAKIAISGGTGALGFKVYAKADSALLYASNHLNFTLPEEVVAQSFFIVAAQADGTDVYVPSLAEGGNESEQYAALKKSIGTAESLVALVGESGMNPGYYISSCLETLRALLSGAKAAYDNKDQTVHPYGEWAVMLDDEVLRLQGDDTARQKVYSPNVYSLTSANSTIYSVALSGDELRCTTASPNTNRNKQWMFDSAGKDRYYLRNCSTGNYVSYIAKGSTAIAASADKSKAIVFAIAYNADGTLTIYDAEQDDAALSKGSSNKVVGAVVNSSAARWLVVCLENNQLQLYEDELAIVLNRAEEILGELVVDYVTGVDNISLQPDVTSLVGGDTLLNVVTSLCELVTLAYENDIVFDDYPVLIERVSALTEYLLPLYRKSLYMPESSTPQAPIFYTIRHVSDDYYWHLEESGNRAGSISVDDVATLSVDDAGMYWYLEQAGADSLYYIYNYKIGRRAAIGSNSYVALQSGEGVPFILRPVEDAQGFAILTMEGRYLRINAMSYVTTSKTSVSYWRLVKTSLPTGIDQTEQDPTMDNQQVYDLLGRRVIMPEKGVYIRAGRKHIVR